MTVGEIKNQIMFQTNNDTDDVDDYEPYLLEYINDGYDRLVKVYAKVHVSTTSEEFTPLSDNDETPLVPEWTHKYIADWASWMIYRNGNPQKQQRGLAFRESFLECLRKIENEGGRHGELFGTAKRFRNMPR